MFLFEDKTTGIEIQKGVNPYNKGKGEMIHIMSSNIIFKTDKNTKLTGLCLDVSDNVVRQTYDRVLNKCFYEVYKNNNHKAIIEKTLETELLTMDDIICLSKRNC